MKTFFMRNLTGLNAHVSFKNGYQAKVKDPQLTLLLTNSRREENWIDTFLKSIGAM